MRLNNEERKRLREWLVEGQLAWERHMAFHRMLYVPQLPTIGTHALSESGPPEISFQTEAIEMHMISLPGRWMQFVCCDPRNDEPLVFGEPYISDRKAQDEHARMVRWIRDGGR